ncbi:uncharacterized protein VP01_2240g5 [Puccinia sorghi]|uniref:Uncharacterized protein n=1 Tax=Puccinia sorghi TaxID=27349 RepID=A0A0L6V977_9BASI|nr:uncharacterized protein VP01_2240g5 [Puccinia sorghi]
MLSNILTLSARRDSSQDRSALNARSSSRHRHVSQPNLPSHLSQPALGKGTTHPEVEDLFDMVLNDKGKSRDGGIDYDTLLARNPSIIVNPATPDPPRSTKPAPPTARNQAPPTDCDDAGHRPRGSTVCTAETHHGAFIGVLHKWLPNVPKLHMNGDNFHTCVVMVQQALEGTLVDETMKVGVAKSLSGLAGFRLISDTFVLRSRTHCIAAMKQLLDLKFDHFHHAKFHVKTCHVTCS